MIEIKFCEGNVEFHYELEKKLEITQPFVNNTGEVNAVV